ncbi:D-alanyl-D-alanine carboxypeptidase-like protein [Kineothrix alysoides]|uniref:D-alanyl-D-alanine carboxypeptidase-like protein n=1 Tax=Kineothrix alysoides TaxID=1469948 RepID=A0A4V2QC17_9FIRM|nr:serine hydrolase [Kineothrix alysoides]TCL58567.1 D-alanyl-D-alanine carboxypeptidase-like protein [Kineothrix alysoides]
MRCINNRFFSLSISTVLLGSILTGCGSTSYEMAYSPDYPVSSYRIAVSEEAVDTAAPFAADLCVVDGDVVADDLDLSRVSSAALFSLSANETILAKNVYEKLAPASLTKIMTALVALKYGSPDEVLTASANVKITESGAQTVGIKEGDQMTLTQALHLLLINSANDAAVMIAEGVGGSIEGFSELMNQEAKEIGATNSNFVNPHGLTADNHYVTAYDMYLIFNAALEYDLINEIISMPSYTTVYKDKNGNDKEISVNTTNLYLQGEKNAPDAITVIGGKTGTTNAAGHCLIILSRDSAGKPYISVILRADDKDILYQDMTDLLSEIKN